MKFRKQVGFCGVCGAKDEYAYDTTHGVQRMLVCSEQCREEAHWRTTLYVMDREYYPRPSLRPPSE